MSKELGYIEALDKLLDGYSKGMAGRSYYDIVREALIKSEKEHRYLEILKKNRVDIESFYTTFIDNAYNYKFYEISYGTYGKYKLTEEQFNLLKEALE